VTASGKGARGCTGVAFALQNAAVVVVVPPAPPVVVPVPAVDVSPPVLVAPPPPLATVPAVPTARVPAKLLVVPPLVLEDPELPPLPTCGMDVVGLSKPPHAMSVDTDAVRTPRAVSFRARLRAAPERAS
jgi:hypothetical protein